MNKTKSHGIRGHATEDATANIAKVLGWKLTIPVERCESFQVAKSKKKAVPKSSDHEPSTAPGERLFLDLSIIKNQRKSTSLERKTG